LSVHFFVDNFVADLKLAEEGEKKRAIPATNHSVQRWTPPSGETIKINVDAMVGKNYGRGTIATIARNAQGVFQGGFGRRLPWENGGRTFGGHGLHISSVTYTGLECKANPNCE
jgi:hypothetical protein